MVTKRLLVNVTLYKYLIFFVIIDSPALILAFAALALGNDQPIHFINLFRHNFSSRHVASRRLLKTPDLGLLKWARTKSPWLLHFNTGACNGCDIEVVALTNAKIRCGTFRHKTGALTPSCRRSCSNWSRNKTMCSHDSK